MTYPIQEMHSFKNIVFFIVVIFSVLLMAPAHAVTFRIATISPGGSFWVKTIKSATKKIEEETDGRVKFKIYPGGVMGSEQVVLRKMRIGQLQGAAVSTGALYDVYPALSLYSVPFLFDSYEQVSYVREHLDDKLKKGAREEGYVVPAIIGGGFAYAMSKKPVRVFEDFKERKVWVPEKDQQTAKNLSDLGLKPIPLSLGDVLMGLETDLIDTVSAPPVLAIALQWHTRISHILRFPIMPIHGSFILDKRVFDKLSSSDKEIVLNNIQAAGEKIQNKNMMDNKAALQAMKAQGIKIVKPNKEERESWQAIEDKSQKQVFETSSIQPHLLKKLQQLAEEFIEKKIQNE